jgi:hypothetical protein
MPAMAMSEPTTSGGSGHRGTPGCTDAARLVTGDVIRLR